MSRVRGKILEKVAKKLNIDYEQLIRESVKHYFYKRVVEVRTEKHKIAGKYGIFTAREIDEKYRKGELEEKGTWEDFFKLDHLEYEEKEILESLYLS